MAPPRLTPDNTCLLLIDVQERLIGQMDQPERLVSRCRYILQIAPLLGLPVAVTEQYVKGLGHTLAALRDVFPPDTPIFEKTQFGACIDPVRDWLLAHRRPNVLLAGMEAHVCILQTAMGLLEMGLRPIWVSDAISAGEPDQIGHARRRTQCLGGLTTGCVSIAYELFADAAHPRFREALALTKAIRP